MLVIVNFGQVFDLENDGNLSFQFTVMDGNGTRVPVSTNESTIRQLMSAALQPEPRPIQRGGNNQPQHQMSIDEEAFRQEMARIEGELDDGDSAFEPDEGEVFGGDYDPDGIAAQAAASLTHEAEAVMGAIAEQPVRPPTPRPQAGLGQGPRVRVDSDGFALPPTARTVPKDEMGYPIVPGNQAQPSIPDDDGEDDGTQM